MPIDMNKLVEKLYSEAYENHRDKYMQEAKKHIYPGGNLNNVPNVFKLEYSFVN